MVTDDADSINRIELDGLLRTRMFGRNLKTYQEVTSTNTIAMRWADQGAPEGSIVQTEFQSEGRGRHGRTWYAQDGQSLLFSVILRPRLAPKQLGLLVIAASCAVCAALDNVLCPARSTVKWPNDILVRGRKCCGMLLDTAIGLDTVVVLGVGINVNQDSFPPDLENRATSLRLETGRHVPRTPLLHNVLECLEQHYENVHAGARATLQAYEARLDGLGSSRIVRRPDGGAELSGTILGITQTGSLQMRTSDGIQQVITGQLV